MSDQEIGKKMVEEMHLDHFADAYQHVTGRALVRLSGGERPDFVCRRGHERRPVGVELTEVRTDSADILDDLWSATITKAEKRGRGNWRYADRTILVLTLTGGPVSRLKYHAENG